MTLHRNSRRPGGPPGGSDGPHALTFALVVVIVVGVLVAVGSSKRPVLPELSPESFLLDDLLDLEDGSGGVSAVSRGKLGPSSASHLDPRARTLHLVQVIRHLVPSTTRSDAGQVNSVCSSSPSFFPLSFFGQPANKKRPDILSNRAIHGLQESRPSTLALFSPRVST